jgi:hypothetical protein
VNEITIVNWEVKGRIPQVRRVRERLARTVPGVGRFILKT